MTSTSGDPRPAPDVRLVCPLPPPGWRCTRKRGHDGPCAAEADPPCTCDDDPARDEVLWDAACPYHGDNGTMVSRFTPEPERPNADDVAAASPLPAILAALPSLSPSDRVTVAKAIPEVGALVAHSRQHMHLDTVTARGQCATCDLLVPFDTEEAGRGGNAPMGPVGSDNDDLSVADRLREIAGRHRISEDDERFLSDLADRLNSDKAQVRDALGGGDAVAEAARLCNLRGARLVLVQNIDGDGTERHWTAECEAPDDLDQWNGPTPADACRNLVKALRDTEGAGT